MQAPSLRQDDSALNAHTLFFPTPRQNEKVEALRIPLNQDTAPNEGCFDQIVGILKSTSASTPIVFNCQAGISRTTTGMVIAAVVKEFQGHGRRLSHATPYKQ